MSTVLILIIGVRMRIYYTFTHINIVSGKVPTTKRTDMMTNSQPKHPSLPEFLSVERVENSLHAYLFARFQFHTGVIS